MTFTAFYNAQYEAAYRSAYNYLKDRFKAEDIVADSFVAVFNKWHDAPPVDYAPPYLFMCIRNKCLDEIKKAGRTVDLVEWNMVADSDQYEDITGALLALVEGALETLPRIRRNVMRLVMAGFSTEEIAAKLGLSIKVARNHRGNGFNSIRDRLGIKYDSTKDWVKIRSLKERGYSYKYIAYRLGMPVNNVIDNNFKTKSLKTH